MSDQPNKTESDDEILHDFEDRLMNQALEELHGAKEPTVKKVRKSQSLASPRGGWIRPLAVAATLLLMVGGVTYVALQSIGTNANATFDFVGKSLPAGGQVASNKGKQAADDPFSLPMEEMNEQAQGHTSSASNSNAPGDGKARAPGQNMIAPSFHRPQKSKNLGPVAPKPGIFPSTDEQYVNRMLPPQPTTEPQDPGMPSSKYKDIVENEFKAVKENPLSTFSIDVDTASYSQVRNYLFNHNQLPNPNAVRIEELINYFNYNYPAPDPNGNDPFTSSTEVGQCPWNTKHRLIRIGLKGKEIPNADRPASNLVFLLDVSGSMNQPTKLPLLKKSLKMLVDNLGENDMVSIVVYAGSSGLVLPATNGLDKSAILASLNQLRAGGSTNGGAGINLAYKIAMDNFIEGGINRVILATDGDFNVGTTSQQALQTLIEQKAKSKVFLTVLGFGHHMNDKTAELLANKGNGNYAFIDSVNEGKKVLVDQMGSTLQTIAKDVKIQIEFNPKHVAAYRLIGYENRMLAARDFNDDKKDAGEIGAGHTVTALYEIVPPTEKDPVVGDVDDLEFQKKGELTTAAKSDVMMMLKVRYKQPDADASKLLKFPVTDSKQRFDDASKDFQFASAVAAFGMLLRDSKHKGSANYDFILEVVGQSVDGKSKSYRAEFLKMVQKAKALAAGK